MSEGSPRMTLKTLLSLFQTFDRARIEYTVIGDLATLLQGTFVLRECFEISVTEAVNARAAILAAWPGTNFMETTAPVLFRALPPETPFYLDVLAQRVNTAVTIELSGVRIRVVSDPPAEGRAFRAGWVRPRFTTGERITAVHSLAREIVPFRGAFRGVRKYRSIQAAKSDRLAAGAPRSPNS